MKKYKYISIVILLSLSSCVDDFSEINSNPNTPTEVHPSLLLRQVIYNLGEEMSYEGFVAGNLLGQYFTQIDFNLFDRHSLRDPQFGGNPWPVLYQNLRDNELVLNLARNNQIFAVYEGPSLILKSYIASMLTDIYGDVPYAESVKGLQGEVTPVYDRQEDIYTGMNGILRNLENGIEKINAYAGAQDLTGDILFDGDLGAWIRFANSLRIKCLMRISDVKDVSLELQSIYNEGLFMVDNSDNAVFSFTEGKPNNFRMSNLRAGDFNLFIMSKTIEEVFTKYSDPRQELFFRPIQNSSPGIDSYLGLINGPDASQTSISVADYSLAGLSFRENTSNLNANFLTAWETSLFLAEASEKGIINAEPKALYDSGVALAFDYWRTEMPADYLSSGNVAYGINGQDKIEQIITQKWIANIINGYEGWIEYRRTGFPNFKTVSASLNNNMIPVRMPYPADEEALNNANYLTATSGNNNSVNAPVWWDIF